MLKVNIVAKIVERLLIKYRRRIPMARRRGNDSANESKWHYGCDHVGP